MEKRRNLPQLRLLRTCCVALLACMACSRAVRYDMDVPIQKQRETAAGSTLVDFACADPNWFVFLEQAGAALIQRAAQGTLPEAYQLHYAACMGDEAQLEACIQSHPKWINKSMNGNVTPLHLAVFQGNVECVRLLLEARASARTLMDRAHAQIQPIHIAAHANALDVLRALLEAQRAVAADVDATGKTALHWAAARGHTLCVRELLQAGGAPNREDNQGHTPLCFAFAGNHSDAIAQLVDAGARVECTVCTHNNSDRLLRWALARKDYKCVAAVIRQGNVPVDIYRRDASGQTLFDCALQTEHLPSIRGLLQRASGANWMNDNTDRDRIPLLHRLISGNHPTLLAELLATSTLDVNAQDANGKTALHLAAEQNLSSMVETLLQVPGIEVSAKDKSDATPLHWAAKEGHLTVVETLLKFPGIDVHSGHPLHGAARGGHVTVVEALLKIPGIAVNGVDQYGRTPLSWAAAGGHVAVVEALLKALLKFPGMDLNSGHPLSWAAAGGHLGVVEVLLKFPGMDVNGGHPLHGAARGGHVAVVEALLKVPGINVNSSVDKYGEGYSVPLHEAAKGGHVAVVEALLKVPGIVVNATDQCSRTPLSWAAAGGHVAVVEALLKIPGIGVNVQDRYGRTPLSWAAAGGHVGVVRVLLNVNDIQGNYKNSFGKTPLEVAQAELQVAKDEELKQRLSACTALLERGPLRR